MRNGGQRFRRDFNLTFRIASGWRAIRKLFLVADVMCVGYGQQCQQAVGVDSRTEAEKRCGSIVSPAQISMFRSFLVSGRPASYLGMICCRVQTLNKGDDNRA
jgi:hypothetical protein